MILLVSCASGKVQKNQLAVRGKTVEEALNRSSRNVSLILHKEEVKNGILVFYIPRIDTQAESKLALEYIRKTPEDWEMSYKGGMYSSSGQTVYFQFFPDDGDKNTPLPLVYGEIKDQDIKQVLVVDLKAQIQKKANIICLAKKPGMGDDMRVWYITLDKTQSSEYEVKGIGSTGEVLFSKKTNVE